MAEQASPQEMNRFVKAVDEFMAKYAKLILPATRTQVYASANPALISDYESAVRQGRILKATIESTVGAWNAAKSAWSSVTGVTSTVIGDAIDEIRSWFGYDPDGLSAYDPSPISGGSLGKYDPSPISGGTLGLLSAIQLPAAAWIAGILGAVYLLNQTMNKIFVSIEASRIQKDNPTISRSQALVAASQAVKTSGFFGIATLPLIAAAALAAWFLFGSTKHG